MRRELEKFELMQIWITDKKIGDLAREQGIRMKKEFRTNSIPLHVVLGADGKELARYTYNPLHSAAEYLKFLREGLAKFEAR